MKLNPNAVNYLMIQLQQYLEKNEERFDENEKSKLLEEFRKEFIEERVLAKNIIADELYDFLVFIGLEKISRYEEAGKTICKKYPVRNFKYVLDVGAGRICRLSKYLIDRGYEVTAIDPKIRLEDGEIQKLELIKEFFRCDEYSENQKGTSIEKYDLIIGLEPCEATEHIIRQCLQYSKPFEITLCMAPHDALKRKTFSQYEQWHDYLNSISQDVEISKLSDGRIIAYNSKQKQIIEEER